MLSPGGWRAALVVGAKGFCVGAADVVPGVSGGTMAFILGIYTRLIDAIKSFDTTWLVALAKGDLKTFFARPDLEFLLPLGAGIFSAFMFFTRVVPLPQFLHSHPEHVYGLFFGLVLGSIFALLAELAPPRPSDAVAVVCGLLAGALIVTTIPTQTPDEWWFVLFCGTLAICAMVLPGVSGSFVLLLLGKYAYVMDSISHFRLSVIVPFAAGAAIGLVFFTRLLSFVLHRHERRTLMAIGGLLCASLWVIWPFQERSYVIIRGQARLLESTPLVPELTRTFAESSAFATLGFALVIALHVIGSRFRETR